MGNKHSGFCKNQAQVAQAPAPLQPELNDNFEKNMDALKNMMNKPVGDATDTIGDLDASTVVDVDAKGKGQVMEGGSLVHKPTRKRGHRGGFQVSYTPPVNDVDLSTDTEALFEDINRTLASQHGGDMSELSTVGSDTVTAAISNLMNGGFNGASGSYGAIDLADGLSGFYTEGMDTSGSDLGTLDSDGLTNIKRAMSVMTGGRETAPSDDDAEPVDNLIKNIINRTNDEPDQAGGFTVSNGSELETLTSDSQMALKSIVLGQLNQQTGGEWERVGSGGVDYPQQEGGDVTDNLHDLYDALGKDNLDRMKEMVNSESAPNAVHVGGYDEDNEDNEDNENDSDDHDNNNHDEDSDSEFEETKKKFHVDSDNSEDDVDMASEDSEDPDAGDNDEESDEVQSDESESDGDDGDVGEDTRQESSDNDTEEGVGTVEGVDSESFGSSDFRRLHNYMDSADSYVPASNSGSGSEVNDFKLGKNDMYTTDSGSNTYKGGDTASEYYHSLKNRNRVSR